MDRADEPQDWVDSHPGRPRRPERPRRPDRPDRGSLSWAGSATARRLGVVAVVVAVIALGLWAASGERSEESRPTGCGVDGRAAWCARPSLAMTSASLASLVRAWCPRFADTPDDEVRPLRLELADLGGGASLASDVDGQEHALLGHADDVAWVTRSMTGRDRGQLEIRCIGSTHVVPGLRLTRAQYTSTLAARSEPGSRRLDLTRVARTAIRGSNPRHDLSFGMLDCDISRVDLLTLRAGQPFSCRFEGYGPPGLTVLGADFRVTTAAPWFRRVLR